MRIEGGCFFFCCAFFLGAGRRTAVRFASPKTETEIVPKSLYYIVKGAGDLLLITSGGLRPAAICSNVFFQ
jgi:hypothetical protein